LGDQRVLALGQRFAPRGLDRLGLLLDQREPRAFALDLAAEHGRHLLAVVGPPAWP
jgi:hypothetical protein